MPRSAEGVICTVVTRLYVTVVGSGGPVPPSVEKIAESVGKLIASRSWVLVCGGRGGVMMAAARGAKKGGGTTLGILPGTSRYEANEYIDIAVPTGMQHARNAVNVLAGDVIIAIGGGAGTLSEIGLALAYARPVIALRGTGGIADVLAGQQVAGVIVHSASSPEEALEKAYRLAGQT